MAQLILKISSAASIFWSAELKLDINDAIKSPDNMKVLGQIQILQESEFIGYICSNTVNTS